uniref:ornithine decarboxylase n=1 Tax=Meloidogyne incognita TaxID=6306 RepID=A0A914NVH2_MELIC
MIETFEPIKFGILAGKEIGIYEQSLFENDGEIASLAIAKNISIKLNKKKIDDAFSIYNLDVVVQRLLQWREMLPRIKPFYAVKCNNDPILLKLLADLGCGFDCASRGEIDQIITNGLTNADNIIYANPCKTRKYIQHADKLGKLKRI